MATSSKRKKENESSSSLTSSIAADDVLMGRGARATENEGNVRFRNIVRSRLQEYVKAPRRQEKDQIAREILGVVKSRKGRFMRKVNNSSSDDSSLYAAVDDDVALLKVKQALRDQKIEDCGSGSSTMRDQTTESQSSSTSSSAAKTITSPTAQPQNLDTTVPDEPVPPTRENETREFHDQLRTAQPLSLAPVDTLLHQLLLSKRLNVAAAAFPPRALHHPHMGLPSLSLSSSPLAKSQITNATSASWSFEQICSQGSQVARFDPLLGPSHSAPVHVAAAQTFFPARSYVNHNLDLGAAVAAAAAPRDAFMDTHLVRLKLLQQQAYTQALLQQLSPSQVAAARRSANFQDSSDLMDAARLLKRHRAS
ncbi:hypothetical protein ACA910_018597 [Epithemia clementina (nom. ined.)]